MKRTLIFVVLATFLVAGCAFIEGALETTFGAGKVPEIEIVTLLPTMDELGLDLDPYGETAGVPTSLESLTLAHVRGALRLVGDCARSSKDADLVGAVGTQAAGTPAAGSTPDRTPIVHVYDCDPVGCPGVCPEGLSGLRLAVEFPAQLVSVAQAVKLRDALSSVSPDSILQFRVRAYALDILAPGEGVSPDAWIASMDDAVGSGIPGTRLSDYMSFMELRAEDDQGNSVVVVRLGWLDSISLDSPQRFDIDIDSGFSRQMKTRILAGEAVEMRFVVDVVVPPEHLYQFPLGAVLVGMRAQPEFVISVLRAALSKI